MNVRNVEIKVTPVIRRGDWTTFQNYSDNTWQHIRKARN